MEFKFKAWADLGSDGHILALENHEQLEIFKEKVLPHLVEVEITYIWPTSTAPRT
jgi:hypothetical protein